MAPRPHRDARARGRRLAVCVAVALASAAALAPPTRVARADRSGLTPAERARLARGELVVRRTHSTHGGREYIGGASWQRIRLPPGAVWRATLDVARYDRLLPEVSEARVIRRDGDRRLVFLKHAKGPIHIEYALWFEVEEGTRIARFRVDRGREGDIRAGWGHLAVYPYRDGDSILSYGIHADIGQGLFQSLVRGQVHEWMLRVPQTVKWYVEGRGRRRYLRATARAD